MGAPIADVLSGERGYGPAAFVGLIGAVAEPAAAIALADRDDTCLLLVDGPAGVRSDLASRTGLPEAAILVTGEGDDADAAVEAGIRAIEALQPGRIEWSTGLAPDGRAWDGVEPFAVARVLAAGAEVPGMLLVMTVLAASPRDVATTLHGATGVPSLVFAAALQNVPPGVGAAIGFAAAAALDTLPPGGTVLFLERVVESGAPLAVWRPRDAHDGPGSIVSTPAGWRLGSDVELVVTDRGVVAEIAAGAFAAPNGNG